MPLVTTLVTTLCLIWMTMSMVCPPTGRRRDQVRPCMGDLSTWTACPRALRTPHWLHPRRALPGAPRQAAPRPLGDVVTERYCTSLWSRGPGRQGLGRTHIFILTVLSCTRRPVDANKRFLRREMKKGLSHFLGFSNCVTKSERSPALHTFPLQS